MASFDTHAAEYLQVQLVVEYLGSSKGLVFAISYLVDYVIAFLWGKSVQQARAFSGIQTFLASSLAKAV